MANGYSLPYRDGRGPGLPDARQDRDAARIERRQAKPRSHAEGEESQGLQDDLAMTVFVYVNTSKQVGDAEHVKVFATTDAAETWFEEND
jgi:hypothetical protein